MKPSTKPRHWIDVVRSLKEDFGEDVDLSHLHLGLRRAFLNHDKVRVVEVVEGRVVKNGVGRIYLSDSRIPQFLLIRRENIEYTAKNALSERHVVTATYDEKLGEWLTIIKCGEGHYGLEESPCDKELGHLKACRKAKS